MEDIPLEENHLMVAMQYRIIYPNDDGSIGIIVPMHPTLSKEQIALKDVPEGKPFKIINASDLPEDYTFRNAWSFDFKKPDGIGMNNDLWHESNSLEPTLPEPPKPVVEEVIDDQN